MAKPEISIVDASTGEQIIREMTTDEYNEYKEYIAISDTEKETAQAEANAKEAQRQAVLNRLGITEEEARILLGGN